MCLPNSKNRDIELTHRQLVGYQFVLREHVTLGQRENLYMLFCERTLEK